MNDIKITFISIYFSFSLFTQNGTLALLDLLYILIAKEAVIKLRQPL